MKISSAIRVGAARACCLRRRYVSSTPRMPMKVSCSSRSTRRDGSSAAPAARGVLDFRGRRYSLSTGGLDYGFVFGGSKTILRGRVSNIWRPSDVAGVYGAAGAGLAVGRGARAIVLTNQKGAVLELTGHQVGLMANADLSGLAITMR